MITIPKIGTQKCLLRKWALLFCLLVQIVIVPPIVYALMRDDDGTPTFDPERFARLKEGLERYCPGMIIQFFTDGRSGADKERGGMLSHAPELASLSVGSNNFPTRVCQNTPDLVDWLASEMRTYSIKSEIEAFDLSHIHQAREILDVPVRQVDTVQGK